MNILFATPYLPVPPDFGGARRMYELICGARRLHEVRTLSLVEPSARDDAAETAIGQIVPVEVAVTARMAPSRQRRALQLWSLPSAHSFQRRLYHHDRFQHALDRNLHSDQTDLVQFEFSQMGCYHVRPGVATLLDVHNIEHDVLRQVALSGSGARRFFNLIEYRKFRREEIDGWRRATGCIATSEADAAAIERQTGRPVPVVPNGVDLEFFHRAPLTEASPGLMVFVGAMRYQPNAEGARAFVEQIFPLIRQEMPQARFAIVGADPAPAVRELAATPGVVVTGTIADVRPWLSQAEIVVVPLLSGGGTRLKILEAFASGRPVVSTATGAAGLAVKSGEHLMIADHPAAFARAVVQLSRDSALRERLVAAAAALVQERYQWRAITSSLIAIQTQIVADYATSRVQMAPGRAQ